ncbi:enoyl-CoA hydratase, mitochondrial [Rhincodon typus]|uniref:enoyl-CoA hydratase, mitochondrial n=1 Tax=Rhincodon typus TaxID=259920 RepID=UPI0020301AA5|nr:enoyl-CoA hydratase, mitochondrial [Rhincodon typus]
MQRMATMSFLFRAAAFSLRASRSNAVRAYSAGGQYQHLLVEKKGEQKNVGFIQLNRPKALNALCDALMKELGQALDLFEDDSTVGAIVLTGSEKAFAAGADIKEMEKKTFQECYTGNFLSHWNRVATSQKPVIAAVNGYAVGSADDLKLTL